MVDPGDASSARDSAHMRGDSRANSSLLPTGTVTFLFTDLEGSTRLWDEHPDTMGDALARHDELLQDAIAEHGGQVVKTTGDGVHAVFATAHDAADAAARAQRSVGNESWDATGPLKVRMGLHTCEAELRDGDYYGSAVNRAARLMSAAHGGQVVVSAATAELVRETDFDVLDLGEHRLRDLARAERVFQLTAPGLDAEFPPLRSLDAFPSNLPLQLTSFVGRDDEVRAIGEEFDRWRLVTLTGVGGVGKTRLAVQAAAELLPRFTDGAWLCELATIGAPELIEQLVGNSLGLTQRVNMTLAESIVDFTRHRRLLIVLDNCEHLLDAAGDLADAILRASADVRILATSREALDVDGERVVRVRSLGVPPPEADRQSLEESAAVRLFAERAEAATSGFTLTEGNAGSVAEICRRLDGIPLAIELAAARVVAMRPPEIAALLGERFRLLTGGRRSAVERHQTLRAVVDWSYSLLEPAERTVFDHLGVFSGSFEASAAIAVSAAAGMESWDVRDALASLVAKSMVVDAEGPDGSTRYELLETIRQYARERLDQEGASDQARSHHASYYASLAYELGTGIVTAAELEHRARLDVELDNIRAALEWSLDRDDPADAQFALMIVAALGYIITRRRGNVGPWIERTADRARQADPNLAGAVLGVISAWYANARGDHERARALALEAIGFGIATDYPGAGVAYISLSVIEMQAGRIGEARRWAEEGRQALEALGGDAYARSQVLSAIAGWALLDGDISTAQARSEQALELARITGAPTAVSNALYTWAEARDRDEPESALAALEEAAGLMRTGAEPVNFGGILSRIADLLEQRGDERGALLALAEAFAHFVRFGPTNDVMRPMAQLSRILTRLGRLDAAVLLAGAIIDGPLSLFAFGNTAERMHRSLTAAREEMGVEVYEALLARGALLDLEESIVLAHHEIARALEMAPRGPASTKG
jgi:predicted ATPase/class 3 adenylate cyclase